MSAVEGNRTAGSTASSVPLTPRVLPVEETDIPGILAGQVADLYAASERERRDVGVERAIARARQDA